MCESFENAVAEQCRDEGFAEGWEACGKHGVKIIKRAMSEIGVPQANYPANIANAYVILEDGQKRLGKEPEDEDYLVE